MYMHDILCTYLSTLTYTKNFLGATTLIPLLIFAFASLYFDKIHLQLTSLWWVVIKSLGFHHGGTGNLALNTFTYQYWFTVTAIIYHFYDHSHLKHVENILEAVVCNILFWLYLLKLSHPAYPCLICCPLGDATGQQSPTPAGWQTASSPGPYELYERIHSQTTPRQEQTQSTSSYLPLAP